MRWLNVSYNDPQVKRQVEQRCGRPYGWWDMVKRGGTGTPRLILADASDDLMRPFDREEDRRFCSIEVRPGGLVLRCRSRLETMALPLPMGDVADAVLGVPASKPHGILHLRMKDGPTLLIHVPRDHWGTVARMLRKALPNGVFRTKAALR